MVTFLVQAQSDERESKGHPKKKCTVRKNVTLRKKATPGASFAFFLGVHTDLFVFRKGRMSSLPASQGTASRILISGDGDAGKGQAGGPTEGLREWEAGLLGTGPSGLGEPDQQRPRFQQVPWDQTIGATLLEKIGNLHSDQEHLKADPKQSTY